MIDRTHALPISQQPRLVGVAKSSVYYRPQPVSEADQLLMRRVDVLHLEFPFAGARMLARLLRREDHAVGRRRMRTPNGCRGAVLQAGHEPPQRAAQDLAIPAARHEDRPRQPGVGTRYDIHSDGAWLRVADGGGRLGEPQGTGSPGRHHAGGHGTLSRRWKKRSPDTGCRTS
jgi:hypothetical protein